MGHSNSRGILALGGVGAPAGILADQTQYPDNYREQLDMYSNWAYAATATTTVRTIIVRPWC